MPSNAAYIQLQFDIHRSPRYAQTRTATGVMLFISGKKNSLAGTNK